MMDIISEIEGTIISFKQGSKTVKFDIPEIFAVDEANLTSDFASQAAMFAFFSTKLADAERDKAQVEMKLEMIYAQADDAYRAEMDMNNRKYTEAVIKSLIIRDEEYGIAKQAEIDSKYIVDLLKAIVNSLKMRADMLISLGAHMRQEMDMTGMSIKRLDSAVDGIKHKIRERKQV